MSLLDKLSVSFQTPQGTVSYSNGAVKAALGQSSTFSPEPVPSPRPASFGAQAPPAAGGLVAWVKANPILAGLGALAALVVVVILARR